METSRPQKELYKTSSICSRMMNLGRKPDPNSIDNVSENILPVRNATRNCIAITILFLIITVKVLNKFDSYEEILQETMYLLPFRS